jgi:hypothetical protein
MLITPLKDELGVKVVVDQGVSVNFMEEKLSKVEFYKRQLDIILQDKGTTETKKYILAYFIVYGKDYKEKVLESRISTSQDSMNNYESALRRENLIHGHWPDAVLNPDINLVHTPYVLISQYSFDEEQDHVNHRNFKN